MRKLFILPLVLAVAFLLLVLAVTFAPAQGISIKYKIVEVHEKERKIVVRFYTDKITEAELSLDTLNGVVRRARTDVAIDIPEPWTTESELHAIILRQPHVESLIREENTKAKRAAAPDAGAGLDAVKALLNKEFNVAIP